MSAAQNLKQVAFSLSPNICLSRFPHLIPPVGIKQKQGLYEHDKEHAGHEVQRLLSERAEQSWANGQRTSGGTTTSAAPVHNYMQIPSRQQRGRDLTE